MKPNLVLLPMDDRPVNYDYPRYLARMAGYELHLPQRDWLGNPWRESQHARLVEWLAQAAASADVLIVAIDTLGYGGLIPARTSREAADRVLERLEVLRTIKAACPGLSILASSVIQRVSRHNSSEEEKDYWATFGSAMFRASYLDHKIALGEATQAEISERETLRANIPGWVMDDYLQGRRRNHAINQAMVDWLAEGIFDYLILPQDDTAEYGWNIAEARVLQARIRLQGLSERAITYPGADEIGCLLLAASLCRQVNFRPRIWPRYSSVASPNVVTAYEDRPIHELLKAHLAPLGGCIAACAEDADLLLYINAPSQAQGEGMYQWLAWRGLENLRRELPAAAHEFLEQAGGDPIFQNTRREMETPLRSPEEFLRSLLVEVVAGKPVALADVTMVNGADLILGNLLVHHPEATRLAAYGGWNTAGNTLGSVLAQAILRILSLRDSPNLERSRAHLEFLFMHCLDDYAYQARVRTQVFLEDLPALGLPLTEEHIANPEKAAGVEACVRIRLAQEAARLEDLFIRSGQVHQVRVNHIRLPWQRLFEVGFDVQATLV